MDKVKDAAATPTAKDKDRDAAAAVARSYRMATAGGDSKVRVCPVSRQTLGDVLGASRPR